MRIVLVTAHEMTAGLSFLHSQGLVHGDLSSGESSNHLYYVTLCERTWGSRECRFSTSALMEYLAAPIKVAALPEPCVR